MPHRESVAMPWRLYGARYRLVGRECGCGHVEFPARKVCRKCGSSEMVEKIFTGNGKIVSFTKIHTAPEGFEDQTPYVVALVKLAEGPVVVGQVTGGHVADKGGLDVGDGLSIGAKVMPVFRKIHSSGPSGLHHYGFKWEISE